MGSISTKESLSMKNRFFIKVFLAKLDLTLGSVFLWLSRFAYITWLIVFIYKS